VQLPREGRRAGRVVLAVLVALTAVVLLLDLARPQLLAPVRRAAATTVAPVQEALTGWRDDDTARLRRERDELAARVAALEARVEEDEAGERLRASASWARHPLLPARAIGFGAPGAPAGGTTLTLDVGSDDGVREDLTVVAADGLVGRVVRVAPTSSDVLILGEPDVVVAVRVGPEGHLGSVRAEPSTGPGGGPRLRLTLLGRAEVRPGDRVVTLGSPDGTPYAAQVPLGTVTEVDPPGVRLETTGTVAPFVDPGTLDHVAVVLTEGP
jgi:rod shape-determining protein MreC